MIRAMVKTFKRADMVATFKLLQICNADKECFDIVDTFGDWHKEYVAGGDIIVIAEGNGGFARFVWARGKGVILNQVITLCGHRLLECNCTAAETDTECMWCLDELLRMDCNFIKDMITMWIAGMPEDKHRKAKQKLGIE